MALVALEARAAEADRRSAVSEATLQPFGRRASVTGSSILRLRASTDPRAQRSVNRRPRPTGRGASAADQNNFMRDTVLCQPELAHTLRRLLAGVDTSTLGGCCGASQAARLEARSEGPHAQDD